MGSNPVGISASRGAAILGVSKYKSPLRAWLEIMEERSPGFCLKNGYETPERIDAWAEPLNPKHASMRWGLGFEDAICDLVGGIENREKYYEDNFFDFPMSCHVDGEKNGINQENKTVFDMAFKMGWGEPGSDMIPEDYQIQVQHQMYLSGLKITDVNALVFPKAPAEWEKDGYRLGKNDEWIYLNGYRHSKLISWAMNLKDLGFFHKYHIEADTELQKEMVERYKLFWTENVLKETPPPVQGYDDIKWLFASPEGELEASEEMRDLWSEYVDTDNEIASMVERKGEIKNIFAAWVQKEILSKKIQPGSEKRKLNVFSGRRKLFSITRAFPGLRISKSVVDTLKEDDPALYEKMKTTSFADILPEEISLTEKQKIKKLELDLLLENIAIKTTGDAHKMLSSFKLSKLLTKESIMKHLEKYQPEMFKLFAERGIVEMTSPKSTLRISKPEKE